MAASTESKQTSISADARPRRGRRRTLAQIAFGCLLAAVFVSHFLTYFLKLTAGVLPASLVALLPTVVTLGLYAVTLVELWDRGLRVPIRPLDAVVLLIAALSLVQVLNDHVTLSFGLRSWQRTAFFTGMYFVGRILVDTPDRTVRVLQAMALTVALAGLFAVAQSLFGLQLEGDYALVLENSSFADIASLAGLRSYGTLVSQAAFGVMSGIGTVTSLAVILLATNWRWQLLGSASLALAGLGLLLSGTRSALLGWAFGILPLLWLAVGDQVLRILALKRVRKSLVIVALSIAVTGAGLVVALQASTSTTAENVRQRLATLSPEAILTGQVLQEQNVTARLSMWRSVLEGIAERPILGYGTGVLGGGSESNRVGVQAVNGRTVADNQYLEIWGEIGLLGLGLYLAVLVSMVSTWFIWRRPEQIHIFSSAVAGVTILVIVSGIGNAPIDYYPANAFFWLIAGIGANLPQLAGSYQGPEQGSAHAH